MILTNLNAIIKLHSLGAISNSGKYIAVCKKKYESNNTLFIPNDVESYLNSPLDTEFWTNYPMYTCEEAIEALIKDDVDIIINKNHIRILKGDTCKIVNSKNVKSFTNRIKFAIEEFINENYETK